jgi:hypothetical protein
MWVIVGQMGYRLRRDLLSSSSVMDEGWRMISTDFSVDNDQCSPTMTTIQQQKRSLLRDVPICKLVLESAISCMQIMFGQPA